MDSRSRLVLKRRGGIVALHTRRSVTTLCQWALKIHGKVWKLRVSLNVDEGERVPSAMGKETNNGLEDPEDRRSSGRHGNQHVCLRGAEVIRFSLSGSQSSDPVCVRNSSIEEAFLREAG